MDVIVLLRLVTAHIFSDFVFQPGSWVKSKRELRFASPYLYLHGLVTGIAAWMALWELRFWWIALIILVTHVLIDGWKLYRPNTLLYFLIDQFLHLLVIAVLWMSAGNSWNLSWLQLIHWKKFWIYGLAFSTVLWPVGYLISYATLSWRSQLEADLGESLEQAGKYIGMLERTLVLIFILTNRYETIGLLIAAKSILRFSESKARKHTEYVLIGTMMSFAITLIIGLAVKLWTTP